MDLFFLFKAKTNLDCEVLARGKKGGTEGREHPGDVCKPSAAACRPGTHRPTGKQSPTRNKAETNYVWLGGRMNSPQASWARWFLSRALKRRQNSGRQQWVHSKKSNNERFLVIFQTTM